MSAIYVASLNAYNNGRLHGAWIPVSSDEDEMREAIGRMLATCPLHNNPCQSEDWAIHGHELGFSIQEYTSLADLATIAEAIETHGDTFEIAMAAFGTVSEAVDACDAYCGAYPSLAHWAYEDVEERGLLKGVPELVSRYFDYEAYARDCDLNGEITTAQVGGDVHVFRV